MIVLWLCNEHYYTHDLIGIKMTMTYRDLPYYEGIRVKTRHQYKLHENKHKNHANPLHTFRKWSITWSHIWSYKVHIGWFAIQWRVQPYTAHIILKMVAWAWIAEVQRRYNTNTWVHMFCTEKLFHVIDEWYMRIKCFSYN